MEVQLVFCTVAILGSSLASSTRLSNNSLKLLDVKFEIFISPVLKHGLAAAMTTVYESCIAVCTETLSKVHPFIA